MLSASKTCPRGVSGLVRHPLRYVATASADAANASADTATGSASTSTPSRSGPALARPPRRREHPHLKHVLGTNVIALRTTDIIASPADALAVIRAVERRFGRVAECRFHRDAESRDRIQYVAYLAFWDLAAYARVPQSAVLLKAEVPPLQGAVNVNSGTMGQARHRASARVKPDPDANTAANGDSDPTTAPSTLPLPPLLQMTRDRLDGGVGLADMRPYLTQRRWAGNEYSPILEESGDAATAETMDGARVINVRVEHFSGRFQKNAIPGPAYKHRFHYSLMGNFVRWGGFARLPSGFVGEGREAAPTRGDLLCGPWNGEGNADTTADTDANASMRGPAAHIHMRHALAQWRFAFDSAYVDPQPQTAGRNRREGVRNEQEAKERAGNVNVNAPVAEEMEAEVREVEVQEEIEDPEVVEESVEASPIRVEAEPTQTPAPQAEAPPPAYISKVKPATATATAPERPAKGTAKAETQPSAKAPATDTKTAPKVKAETVGPTPTTKSDTKSPPPAKQQPQALPTVPTATAERRGQARAARGAMKAPIAAETASTPPSGTPAAAKAQKLAAKSPKQPTPARPGQTMGTPPAPSGPRRENQTARGKKAGVKGKEAASKSKAGAAKPQLEERPVEVEEREAGMAARMKGLFGKWF